MSCPILTLPVEIGQHIIKTIESLDGVHALSLSCKAFTEPCRERLFSRIYITLPPFFYPQTSDEVLRQETRLERLSKMARQTAYIEFVTIRAKAPDQRQVTFPPHMQATFAGWLERMTNLNHLRLSSVDHTNTLVLSILKVAAYRSITLELHWCTFQSSFPRISGGPLRIHDLSIRPGHVEGFCPSLVQYTPKERQSIPFAASLVVAAQANITTLTVDQNTPLALKDMLGTVLLPSLRVFKWTTMRGHEGDLPAVIESFLRRHTTIVDISVGHTEYYATTYSFPSLAWAAIALPELRSVTASARIVEQLVPGRPVTSIKVSIFNGVKVLSGVPASTATITKLCLVIGDFTSTWEDLITSVAQAAALLQDLELQISHPPYSKRASPLAYRPLALRLTVKLPHLRYLDVKYNCTPSAGVLAMYSKSFMKVELKNLRAPAMKEIIIDGNPRTHRELILSEFIRGCWSVRIGDIRIVV
jgi:hypothetical protein